MINLCQVKEYIYTNTHMLVAMKKHKKRVRHWTSAPSQKCLLLAELFLCQWAVHFNFQSFYTFQHFNLHICLFYLLSYPLWSFNLSLILYPGEIEREMDFWINMPFVSIMLVKLYLPSILSLTCISDRKILKAFFGPQALLSWLSWIKSPDFQEFQLPINCIEANGICSPETSRNSKRTRETSFNSQNLDWIF